MPKSKFSRAIAIFALVMLAVFAVAVACGPDAQPCQVGPPSGGSTSTPHPYLNLDDALRELAQGYDAWLASGQRESAAPVTPHWEVGVYLYLTAHREAVSEYLEGKVQGQAEGEGNGPNGEDTIATAVPVSLLGQLSGQPGVSWVEKTADPMRQRPTPSPTEPPSAQGKSQAPRPTRDPDATIFPPHPTRPILNYPNMEGELRKIVDQYESEQIPDGSADADSEERNDGDRYIWVTIFVTFDNPREQVAAVLSFLEENGSLTNHWNCGGYPDNLYDAAAL